MKYWVLCGIMELQKRLGNRFRYNDVVRILKYRRESVSEFVKDSRNMEIVKTERDKSDLRNVWVIINERKLERQVKMAINILELRINEFEEKRVKYQGFLNKLRC